MSSWYVSYDFKHARQAGSRISSGMDAAEVAIVVVDIIGTAVGIVLQPGLVPFAVEALASAVEGRAPDVRVLAGLLVRARWDRGPVHFSHVHGTLFVLGSDRFGLGLSDGGGGQGGAQQGGEQDGAEA